MNDEYITIRLSDFLHTLIKNRGLIAATTIAGLAIGVVLSIASYMRGEMAKGYSITSSIAVTTQDAGGNFTTNTSNPDSSDIQLAEDMVDAVIYVLKSDRTLKAAIQNIELVGIAETDIYKNLLLTRYKETQIIEMDLTWRSAEEGVEILNAINEVAPEILIETLKIGSVSVINEPKATYRIGGNVNASMWLYMSLLGLAVGIGFSFLKFLLLPTVVNTKDIENTLGLEVLGEIPENVEYFRRKKSLLVEDDDPMGAEVRESFVSAAHILHNRLGVGEHQCIYITSAEQDEGKTHVAANLAVQLSDLEHKVLLIDLDVRNPSLGGLFLDKVDYAHSLNALYRGDASPEDVITHLTGYLDLLPSILEPKEIPLSDALLTLIKDLSQNYDYVLMDSAPVGRVAETLSLNRIAKSALFVIRFDYSNMNTIRDSLERLDKSGINPLGCIVNRVKTLGDKLNNNNYNYESEGSASRRGRGSSSGKSSSRH